MKILFITGYSTCIRAKKTANILLDHGEDVFLLEASNKDRYYDSDPCWTKKFQYPRRSFLGIGIASDFLIEVEKILKDEKIDLIHYHNEPTWPVFYLAQLNNYTRNKKIPVILDCHDLDFFRFGNPSIDEKCAFEMCDAFIFPSNGYQSGVRDYMRPTRKIKSQVIYSMPLKKYKIQKSRELLDDSYFVYQGGISIDKTSYRYYFDILNSIAERIPVTIFSATDNVAIKNYYEIKSNHKIDFHLKLPYSQMMNRLRNFRFGFVGGGFDHIAFQYAMPNKFFEYLISGVRPIVVGKQTWDLQNYIKENNLDILCVTHEELKNNTMSIFRRAEDKKLDIEFIKKNCVMESQIKKLLKFYGEIV